MTCIDLIDRLPRAARRGLLALGLACLAFPGAAGTNPAAAKSPGHRHCYGDVCHRVMSLAQTAESIGKISKIVASHYDDCHKDRFNPCGLTSSGETFRPDEPNNAASAIHPDGTILLLRNAATQRTAVVRVNNFGPFKGNRRLDVSRATAERLAFAGHGVATLDVMVSYAPTPEEARYKARRRYPAVPGFIGRTASIEQAFLAYAETVEKRRFATLSARACQLPKRARTPRLALIHALPRPVRPQA